MRMFMHALFIFAFSFMSSAHAEKLFFKNKTLEVHALFATAPHINKESFMRLEFYDAASHQLINVTDQIKVDLWMSSMGHGSSPTQVAASVDQNKQILTGLFDVSKMYFMMGGNWDVKISLIDADGNKETQQFYVKPIK